MRKPLPIFYGALLLTGVNLLLRFVSTSFQVYISAKIGPEGVGLLQLVLSVGSLALTAGIAGIRTATMYLTAAELGQKKPENIAWVLRGCVFYSLSISAAISFLLYYGAPFLARNWIGNIKTADTIRIYAKFLPVVCLTGCMTGYFTAANQILTLAVIEIFEQLCYMIITMSLLVFRVGSSAEKACEVIVMGSGISSLFTLVLLLLLHLRQRSPKGPRISIRKRLLQTAVPLALADDMKAGISTTENLMVPKRLALYAGEFSPLATFGIIVGMVFPVLMFPAAILYALAELLIPELAKCAAARNRRRIRYLVRRSLRLCAIYGFLCGGILFLIAEPLCAKLYGNASAGKHLRLYSLLAPMLYCDAITDAMIKGLGQQAASMRYNILTSSLDVILLFILLPQHGMAGYFISFLITHLINFILSIRRLLRISQVRLPLYPAVKASVASALSATAAATLPSVGWRIPAYLSLFFSVLILMGSISKRDLLWIKALIIQKHPH